MFLGYVSEIYGQDDNNPRFDAIISGIEARIAETVLLPCTVRNTGDKVVSFSVYRAYLVHRSN